MFVKIWRKKISHIFFSTVLFFFPLCLISHELLQPWFIVPDWSFSFSVELKRSLLMALNVCGAPQKNQPIVKEILWPEELSPSLACHPSTKPSAAIVQSVQLAKTSSWAGKTGSGHIPGLLCTCYCANSHLLLLSSCPRNLPKQLRRSTVQEKANTLITAFLLF